MGFPSNSFLQGELSTCMFSSLACAVHGSPCTNVAEQINQAGRENEGAPKLVVILLRTFDSFSPPWTYERMKDDFIILRERNKYPMKAILKGSDGSVQHVVVSAMWGWLYDSNSARALPLRKEVLDCCVSDDSSEETFLKCELAYRFFYPESRKRKPQHKDPNTGKRARFSRLGKEL